MKSAVSGVSVTRKTEKKKKTGNIFLSGLKNFGIVFVMCLVIFGLLATLAVSFVTSAVDDIFEEKSELEEILKKDMEEASANTDDLPIPDGESFTVFIAVTDYDPAHFNYYPHGKEFDKLNEKAFDRSLGVLSAGYKTISTKLNVVVRFDKERSEYTITPISSRLTVFTPFGYKYLGDLFYEFGPQYLIEKVSAVTGLGIDYYLFLDAKEAPKLATALGGFNVEISKDIYSDEAAFGTAERSYGNVFGVIPPETVAVENKKKDKDKKDKSSDSDDAETEETEETTIVTAAPETTEESEEDGKEPREAYQRVCSAGTVTVSPSNIRALLMFDDYDASSPDERARLEFQLVRGALLRLSSMSASERLEFYDSMMVASSVDELSVTLGPPRGIVEKKKEKSDDNSDEQIDGQTEVQPEKQEEPKPVTDPGGYSLLTDGKISTDISRKTAQLKSDMIAAAMYFPIKHLEFSVKSEKGNLKPSDDSASVFYDYKMPPDPEKISSTK